MTTKLEQLRWLRERNGRFKAKPKAVEAPRGEAVAGLAGFDRLAYQREYMRKWRASRKANSQ